MAAAPGNQYASALKTPELKQKAFNLFCEHLAKGKAVKSWYYEDDEGNCCTWETMNSYIKDNPKDFDPIKKTIAQAKGYQEWESIAELSAKGENKANTASLQMVMRNKFGWDKDESKTNGPINYNISVNRDLASGIDISAAAISDALHKGSK